MPPSSTPTPTPSGLKGASPQQVSRLQGLVSALKKAGVSDSKANQVVQQQAEQKTILGYIDAVTTIQNAVFAELNGMYVDGGQGSVGTFLWFPPNDQKFLAECVRAMNYKTPVEVGLGGTATGVGGLP